MTTLRSTTILVLLLMAGLLCSGCDKLDNAKFTLNLNGKQVQVKGLKGLKDLVTGNMKPDDSQAAQGSGGGAVAEARANGGTLQDRRRPPKPPMVPVAEAVDMKLLAAGHPSKEARALIGKTVLCNVVGIINREPVGDRDSKAGTKFVKGIEIGKLYARLYCRKDPKSEERVAVVSFLPIALAPSIDWLLAGDEVNIKLLGHRHGKWFALIQGIASTSTDHI